MFKKLISAFVFVFLAGVAQAHTVLDASKPAQDAIIAQAPSQILLVFKRKVRLTSVTVTDDADVSKKLDGVSAAGFSTDHELTADLAGVGVFSVDWRGLGSDGHVLTGSFSFEVRP